jgi:TonB family protein
MGGFGDPNGIKPAQATNTGPMLAKLGSFDRPQGAGNGGANGNGAIANGSAVKVGGFGSAATGNGSAGNGPGGNGTGLVRNAGFSDMDKPVIASPSTARPAAPSTTPVEILSKPKPAYTDMARAKKLEGEVKLEVLFAANGEIRVLRVVQGLGSGLDENAEVAAARIRFRPSTLDGRPVDTKGIVHIVFQLL